MVRRKIVLFTVFLKSVFCHCFLARLTEMQLEIFKFLADNQLGA